MALVESHLIRIQNTCMCLATVARLCHGISHHVTQEPSLVPALPESVDLSRVLASSSLPHRASRRVANPDLRPVSTLEPPWGDKTKRDQWKNRSSHHQFGPIMKSEAITILS